MGDLTDDETLMAYADGGLSPAEAAAVEAAIARRPDLQARVAVYRRTGRNLGRVYDGVLHAPLPAALRARLGLGNAADGSEPVAPIRGSAAIVRLDEVRAARRAAQGYKGRNWTIAACVAALAGVTLFAVVRASPPAATGLAEVVALDGRPLFGTLALGEVLERRAAPSPVAVAGAGNTVWRITPTMTFRAKDQRWCREYSAESGTAEALRITGLSCRRGDGRWTIEALADAHSAPAPSEGVRPAGDSASAIEAVIERVRGGEPLASEAVSRLIAEGWPGAGR